MSTLFKKATATAGVFAIVASSMSATFAATTSEFLQYADALATAGIINKNTEVGYRLGDSLTRAEMAKIAANINGATPDVCTGVVYFDVTANLGDLCGYIEAASAAGLVSKTQAKFRPLDKVTRAEATKMLLTAKEIPPTTIDAGFKDLIAGSDLNGYINAAAAEGIIRTGTTFRPNDSITRGESFKIAANALGSTTGTTEPDLCTLFGTCTTTGTTSTGTTSTSTGTTSTGTTNTGAVVVPTGVGTLGLALSADTPNPMTVPYTAKAVPFTKIGFTASADSDITINSIVIKRKGVGATTDIDSVYLYNGAQRITDGRSVSSQTNESRFSNLNIVVKAGSTLNLMVRADLVGQNSASAQHQFGIEVGGVESTAKTVNQVAPIYGNLMTLAAVTTGTATLSVRSVANTEASVGSQNMEISKFNIQLNSVEDASLKAITLALAGNVRTSDVANFKLVRNGTVLATTAAATKNGSTDAVTFVLTSPLLVGKGSDVTLSVMADIIGGRNADKAGLYLANKGDLLLEGGSYGFNLNVDGTVNSSNYYTTSSMASLPGSWTSGTTQFVTIKAGKLTFAYTGPASRNVAKSTNDVVLGAFNTQNDSGADVEVKQLQMTINASNGGVVYSSTGLTPVFTNIRLVEYSSGTIGKILSTVNDPTNVNTTSYAMNFKDVFNFKPGKTGFAVIANIPSAVGALTGNYNVLFNPADAVWNTYRSTGANVETFASTAAVYNDVVPAGSGISSNTMTLVSSALSASYGANPSGATYVKGQTLQNIGSVVLTAADAGDLTLNSLAFASTGGIRNYIGTVYLYNGDTLLPGNATKSFDSNGKVQFSNLQTKIPTGQSITLTVKGDLSSSATNVSGLSLALDTAGMDVTQSTGGSVTNPTVVNGNAGIFAITAGGSVIVRVASLASQTINAGTDNVLVGEYTFRPADINYNLNTITFAFQGSTGSTMVSGTLASLTKNLKAGGLSLYVNGASVATGGSLQSTATGGIVRFTGLSASLPKDVTTTVQLKANFATAGTNGAVAGSLNQFGIYTNIGDTTDDLKLDPTGVVGLDSLRDTNVSTAGTASGIYFASTTSTGSNTLTMFSNANTLYRSTPVVASQGGTTSDKPLVFTITAPQNDEVVFTGVTITSNANGFAAGMSTGTLRVLQNGNVLATATVNGTSTTTVTPAVFSSTGLVTTATGSSTAYSTAPVFTFTGLTNEVRIGANQSVTVEFNFTSPGRAAAVAASANFSIKSDSVAGTTGNFLWTDGAATPTTYNGFNIIKSDISGSQFTY